MANKEHLAAVMLGPRAISEWMEKNPNIAMDLSGANLRRINLVQVNLNGANLQDTNFEWADLRWSDLQGANLSRSNLTRADLHKTDLSGANLTSANLTMTNLEDSNLSCAILDNAIFSFTRLISTSLFNTKGLCTVVHQTPSIVDKETISKSGSLPIYFTKHLTSNTNAEAILAGYEFEHEVADLYRSLGLNVEENLELAGAQIDILLTEKTKKGKVIKTAVECKALKKPVGRDLIYHFALVSNLLKHNKKISKSILVSKSGFTRPARNAATEFEIELRDINDLKQMIKEKLNSIKIFNTNTSP